MEVKPSPNDVGYPSFKFWFHYDIEEVATCVAVYCFEKGKYTLLSCLPEWDRKVPAEL